MLLAMAFHWKAQLYVFGHWGVRLAMTLAGIRCRMAGREHIPLDLQVDYQSRQAQKHWILGQCGHDLMKVDAILKAIWQR